MSAVVPAGFPVTRCPPGRARGLEPDTLGDYFLELFGDPWGYRAVHDRTVPLHRRDRGRGPLGPARRAALERVP